MNKYLLLLVILFSSCSHHRGLTHKDVILGKDLRIRSNSFLEIFPMNTKIVQLVTYTRGEEVKKAQVIFTMKDVLNVSVLSPMGIELLSLRVTDEKIERIGGLKEFKLEFFYKVMGDMLAVYAPKKLLSRDIIGEVSINETAVERLFSKDKEKIISIQFDQSKIWKSKVIMKHHQFGYKLNIETLAFKHESIYK